jgi:hypothetical protein
MGGDHVPPPGMLTNDRHREYRVDGTKTSPQAKGFEAAA